SPSSSRQWKGQISTQNWQPVQLTGSITGLGQSVRFRMRGRISPRSFSMHSTGQAMVQAPQSMQSSGAITWSCCRSPLMALVGQTLTQAVQPIHVSRIKWAIKLPSSPEPAPGSRWPPFRLAQPWASTRSARGRKIRASSRRARASKLSMLEPWGTAPRSSAWALAAGPARRANRSASPSAFTSGTPRLAPRASSRARTLRRRRTRTGVTAPAPSPKAAPSPTGRRAASASRRRVRATKPGRTRLQKLASELVSTPTATQERPAWTRYRTAPGLRAGSRSTGPRAPPPPRTRSSSRRPASPWRACTPARARSPRRTKAIIPSMVKRATPVSAAIRRRLPPTKAIAPNWIQTPRRTPSSPPPPAPALLQTQQVLDHQIQLLLGEGKLGHLGRAQGDGRVDRHRGGIAVVGPVDRRPVLRAGGIADPLLQEGFIQPPGAHLGQVGALEAAHLADGMAGQAPLELDDLLGPLVHLVRHLGIGELALQPGGGDVADHLVPIPHHDEGSHRAELLRVERAAVGLAPRGHGGEGGPLPRLEPDPAGIGAARPALVDGGVEEVVHIRLLVRIAPELLPVQGRPHDPLPQRPVAGDAVAGEDLQPPAHQVVEVFLPGDGHPPVLQQEVARPDEDEEPGGDDDDHVLPVAHERTTPFSDACSAGLCRAGLR